MRMRTFARTSLFMKLGFIKANVSGLANVTLGNVFLEPDHFGTSSSFAWNHGSLRFGKIVSNFVVSNIMTRGVRSEFDLFAHFLVAELSV